MDKLKNCRLFLLDMDGTLYLGDQVYDGAIAFVQGLMDSGYTVIYLTNNSSRAGEDYIPRLRRLGFPCSSENVYTSGMATAKYLARTYPGRAVFPVGTRAFCRELRAYGVEVGYAEDAVVAVGFDTELVYDKLNKAVHLLRRGAPFIAANPDLVCPMPGDEALPDCGSICALLTAASGREPLYIGKPNRNLVDIISKEAGVPNGNICCVGDRLYTDIAVAANAGAVSALVLSGETNMDMLKDQPVQPDYIFDDVKALGKYLGVM